MMRHNFTYIYRVCLFCALLLWAVLTAAACTDAPPPVDTSGPAGTVASSPDPSDTGVSAPDSTDTPGADTVIDGTGAPAIDTLPVFTLPPYEPENTDPSAETLPYDPENHPGDSTAYKGVMIASVYGTGKKGAEAVMSHGYVQLYNSTDKAISLSGAALYYKTDDANPYDIFLFPEGATVPAGGYYLVRANAPADFVPENAIMTVDAFDAEWDIFLDNKEIRLLLAPAGWTVGRQEDITCFDDAISLFVASETYNGSVYAVTDLSRNKIAVRTAMKGYSGYHLVNLTRAATPELRQLCTRTSNGTVNAVVASRIAEVLFSLDAGVHPTATKLHLTAPQGYTIYYTTDGTDPSSASNKSRKAYTGVIALSDTTSVPRGPMNQAWRPSSAANQIGAHVIKAYATNGRDSTAVFTNTYFITDSLAAYGVTVMSISIPKDEMLGSGFYENYLSGGSITATRPRGVGILEVFDASGCRVGNSRVEMAVSGNGSSGFGMKSLRIYYKGINNQDAGLSSDLNYDLFAGYAKDADGEAITSFSRLLLRNSGNDCGTSYIRDAYMQRVCGGLSIDTMASASTLVFVNGEFWGVYNARERYSPEYVESHYGVQKENVTVIESDYSQVHTNTNAPFVVSSGVEGDADPFNEMVDFMRQNNLSDQAAYDHVASLMDIDSFIDMWVTRIFFVARDWPENNIKVWRNKNPDDPSGVDTKWHFTLLDMDMGFSFYDFTTERENFFWALDSGSVTGTIMRALMQNEGFKNQFILRYYEVVTEHLTKAYMSAELEAMIAERDPLMPLQAGRWAGDGASVSTWQNSCEKMRSFVNGRTEYALQHLYSRFGITEDDIFSLGACRVGVSYHDGRVDVSVNGGSIKNGEVLRFENGQKYTLTFKAVAKEGYTITAITYTDSQGNKKSVEGGDDVAELSATFTVAVSGQISIVTRRIGEDAASRAEGKLIAGATYLFYLTKDGELYAWGDNRHGVLGLPNTGTTVATPTYVMSGVAKVVTSAANAYENGDTTFTTAVLTTDGRVLTVGRNSAGQLGRNGTLDDMTWGEIEFNGRVKDVSIGNDHMLILDDKGNLWGIGSNSYGALGPKNVGGNVLQFEKIAANVTAMSAGRRSTVYITADKKLWGVGDNRWKKMSQSHGDQIHSPVVIAENITFVDSGEHQVLAVDTSGRLTYAGWRTVHGFNQGGGNNPTFVPLMNGVKKADIYFGNAVILTNTGDAYVYGLNTDSGIGSSAVTDGKPKKFLSDVADVAAGYGFTAYLMKDGRILIQGDNSFGQAGNGQTGGTVSLGEVDY